MEQKSRRDTCWENELIDGQDTAVRREDNQEIRVVLLSGLQRLANMAGLEWSDCSIITPSNEMIQVIYRTKFSDGTQWVGTADCNPNNTKSKFLAYPTAVAESRAEARCLRKALGIRMLSSEEIGFKEGFVSLEASLNTKADSQLIAAIAKLCETRNIDPVQVIEEVVKNDKRASSIFELSELTTDEAQKALSWLNEAKTKKKLSAKEERDARKVELQSKNGV